jgi:hypothetical protein
MFASCLCVSFSISIIPFSVHIYIYVHMMDKMRGKPHRYVVKDPRLIGAKYPKMNLPAKPRMTTMTTAATDVVVSIIYIYIILVTGRVIRCTLRWKRLSRCFTSRQGKFVCYCPSSIVPCST